MNAGSATLVAEEAPPQFAYFAEQAACSSTQPQALVVENAHPHPIGPNRSVLKSSSACNIHISNPTPAQPQDDFQNIFSIKLDEPPARRTSINLENNPVSPPKWGSLYNRLVDSYQKWLSKRPSGSAGADIAPTENTSELDSHLYSKACLRVIGKSCEF